MSCLVVISHCLHRLPRALLGVLVLVIWMVGAGSASAAAYTWNVAGGGSWGNSANWAPVGVPGTGDTVAIGLVTGGSTITLDGNRSVVSLALSSTNSHVIAAGTSSLTLTSTGTAISITAAGTPTFSCPMVLGASQTWASGTVSPLVSGVVSGAFTLTTSGSWKFTGNNTFTQGVAVSSGTLIAAANNALGTIAVGTTVASGGSLGFEGGITYSTAEAVTLNGVGAASDGAMVNVSGTNSFAGPVTLASDATIGSRAGALTLSGTVNTGGFVLTIAGDSSLTVSGIVSGSTVLSKNGAGTTTLSAANTYAGYTDVNDGTLLVTNASGSGTGTSTVAVNSGTLGGTGTISGAVEGRAGASFAPGSGGAGTLTISKASATALSLAYNAALNYELGTASDFIALTGTGANLILDGTVNVTAGSGFAVGTYTLITYTGTLTDDDGLQLGTLPPGHEATINTATPGQVRLVVTRVLTPYEEWQISHFGSTTSPDASPTADPDGDSTSNETEFRLGLDPKNGSSSFKATGSLANAEFTLTWPSAAGLVFEIRRSASLDGPWKLLDTRSPIVSGPASFTDTAPLQPRGFYRIALLP